MSRYIRELSQEMKDVLDDAKVYHLVQRNGTIMPAVCGVMSYGVWGTIESVYARILECNECGYKTDASETDSIYVGKSVSPYDLFK